MKLLTFTCCLLLLMSSAYAQSHSVADQRASKFAVYFNAAQTDSLYALCADGFTSQVPKSSLGAIIYQLKNAYGSIVSHKFVGAQNGFKKYTNFFEKPGVGLSITFDTSDKIIGFFKEAVTETEAPGSVTVETSGAMLKGTLSVPPTTQPVPVVLIIAGSGPTDRDGNSDLSNAKINSYLLLSDELTLKNIAVLRFDKRGVGTSTATSDTKPTFNDEVNDAEAMVKYLEADKRFSKVIIAGHSEGSLIGMLIAEREPVSALISLSGAGFPADEVIKKQLTVGLNNKEYQKAELIIDSLKSGNFPRQKLDLALALTLLFTPQSHQYMHDWMQYNPQQEIAKLKIPVLLVQGTNDPNVSESDVKALKKAYPKAQLKLIPGMNHELKDASVIATSLNPQLIPAIAGFINGK